MSGTGRSRSSDQLQRKSRDRSASLAQGGNVSAPIQNNKSIQLRTIMTINRPVSESGSFNPRIVFGLVLCCAGIFLAMFGFAAAPPNRGAKKTAVAAAGSWSIVTSPNTSSALENDLYGVA